MVRTQFHPHTAEGHIVDRRFVNRRTVRISIFSLGLFLLGCLLPLPSAVCLGSEAGTLRVVMAQQAVGQFGDFDFRPDESLFLPVPREQSIRIERIRAAAEDKRWTDAAQELASILSDSEYEDYVTRSKVNEPANESLKAYVSGLMAELPSSVWESYQLLVGAEARALLDEALETRDQDKLGEVVRRYLHTKAGERATVVLARLLMDRRQWEGAYLLLGKLDAIRPSRRELVMESDILRIVCRASSGDREAATKDLESFLARHGQQNQLFPESLRAVADDPQQLLERLVRLNTSAGQLPYTWTLFQGDATRNAQSRGSEPLREVMWNVRLAHSRQEQQRIQKAKQSLMDSRLPVIPAIQPIVVQDQVIFRTPNSLLATDVRTGKILWKFPWDSLDSETTETPDDPSMQGDELLKYAIWADTARGHLASDGRRVFFVHEDRVTGGTGTGLMIGNANFMMRSTRQMRENSLICLDINREGATVWMLGNSDDENGAGLSGARFLGPPLPADGQLFALARVIDETRLISIDPETGSILWSQQLSHSPLQHDQSTDFSLAASPSYHGGILVCPTNAGVLVAIDTVSRTILWGYQYKEIEPARNNRRININNRTNNQDESMFGNRWTDGTPLIQGNRVVVTPPDSDELLCLDLLSGKPIWTRDRDEGLNLACIDGDTILQINRDSLLGIDLETGEPAWQDGEITLPQGAVPSGYGFRRDGTYFLPTTKETILPVDIQSGEMGVPIASGGNLGNLVCYDQFVLAASPEYVTAFKQIDALRREVELRLADSPDDAEALRHQGSLLLHDGKLAEALTSLRRSYEINPIDDTRHALVATGLAALAADFQRHESLVPQLESLVETAEDQLLLARLKATGLHQQGQYLEAFEAYLDFADLASGLLENSPSSSQFSLEPLENNLKAHYGRALRGFLVDLADLAEPAELEKMEALLAARLDDIPAGAPDEAARLTRFVTHFQAFEITREAKVRLASRLLKEDSLLEAEIAVRSLFSDEIEPERLAPLVLAMAERLESEGLAESAAPWYGYLAAEFADVPVRDGKSAAEILNARKGAARGLLPIADRWSYRNVSVETEQHQQMISRQHYAIRLRELNQVAPSGYGIRLDNQENQFLINGPTGELSARIPFTTASGKRLYNPQIGAIYAEQLGHLLVVSLGDEILAFDALPREQGASEERLLWNVQLQNEVPGARSRTTRVTSHTMENPLGENDRKAQDGGKPIGQFCLTADGGVCYQQGSTIICADPLSGEILWQRERMPIGSRLIASDRHLVAIPPGRSNKAGSDVTAVVLSIDNGKFVRELELPDPLRIWTDREGVALCWRELTEPADEARRYEIEGVDVVTGEVVWQRQLAPGTQAALLQRSDGIAVLEPSGDLEVLNFVSGETHFTDQVEAGEVQRLKLLEDFDQFFLFVYRPFDSDSTLDFRCVPHDASEKPLQGEVYAFDAETGERRWEQPARISNTYFVETHQPMGLPVLTFVARVKRSDVRPPAPNPVLAAMVLDRRDGRVLFQGEFGEISLSYVISGNPESEEIRLQFDSQRVLLRPTDQPRIPAPPAANALDYAFPPAPAESE